MKRIVSEYTECEPVKAADAVNLMFGGDGIIAYRTIGGNIAGLVSVSGSYGFVYMRYLLRGKLSGIKASFRGDSGKEAVLNALKAGGEVLYFEGIREFFVFCAENYQGEEI